MAVVCSLVALVLPRTLEASLRRQAGPHAEDPGRLWTLYQTRLILVAALLEGAGFMQAIFYLMEGQTFSLAVALVLLAWLALLFPTRAGVEEWVERQQELARQGRWG
jgi:hypothetical protein